MEWEVVGTVSRPSQDSTAFPFCGCPVGRGGGRWEGTFRNSAVGKDAGIPSARRGMLTAKRTVLCSPPQLTPRVL